MSAGKLGKTYHDHETIVREGEVGDCMYIVQEGRVEVMRRTERSETRLAILEEGDFFGEMAIFEGEVRSATVRALGETRVLTVDKLTLLRRIQDDPLMAVDLLETLSHRIRRLNAELSAARNMWTVPLTAPQAERVGP